jgi:hypothetical protein
MLAAAPSHEDDGAQDENSSQAHSVSILPAVSWFGVVLLVAAAALLVAAEWHRFGDRVGAGSRRGSRRRRAKQKAQLRVVHPETEEFARSVERDLAALPTIDEQDAKR